MVHPVISIDDRQLQGRLRRLGDAGPRVARKARNQSARELQKHVKRDLGHILNMPTWRIAKPMSLRYTSDTAEFHVRYTPAQAHHFLGWTYRHAVGSRIGGRGLSRRQFSALLRSREVTTIRGRARGERTRVSRLTRRSYGNLGLTVRFRKGESVERYERAFRTSQVGSGRVFIQRKGRSRYPLESIHGPSVWGEALDRTRRYEAFGTAELSRRMQHWADREADRI